MKSSPQIQCFQSYMSNLLKISAKNIDETQQAARCAHTPGTFVPYSLVLRQNAARNEGLTH